MKKVKVHEFDCQIYPRLIWVTVDASEKALKDLFGDDVSMMGPNDEAMCSTETRQKPQRRSGCLLQFHKGFDEATACHEAVHAATDILCGCGVNTDMQHQEPLAYLTEWVFKCCMTVKASEKE